MRTTPVFSSRSLSARCGGEIHLKAENLQRTGSFKLRGALSKLGTLPATCREVVAGSAGNHAQALAYAARTRGIGCAVYLPAGASVAKIAAIEAFGARVLVGGDSVESAVAHARDYASEHGATFVHPFDDIDVLKGQAGVGLELCEQVPDLAKVIVPVGGGGLACGIAMAIRSLRSEVEIVGVQADACAPYADMLHGSQPRTPTATIADGIAVKRPGELTRPLVQRLLDDIVTVGDDQIAEAMLLLLERSKLLAEGAGAAATAALVAGASAPAPRGATVVIISGGNVDVGILAGLIARHETVAARRLRLATRVPDRSGGLAGLLAAVAASGASVREVLHVREGIELHVAETGIELLLETRGASHARAVVEQLTAAGHPVRVLHDADGPSV
ncbi:MAG: pyridoxal-phosphate dependent enzyme [Solirubrobacteraceae bacterium]